MTYVDTLGGIISLMLCLRFDCFFCCEVGPFETVPNTYSSFGYNSLWLRKLVPELLP